MQRSLELALRERVKELGCLYQVAKLSARPGIAVEGMLGDVVQLLPPAMLHASAAFATLDFDGRRYQAGEGSAGGFQLGADVLVNGIQRGRLQLGYRPVPEIGPEDPFLPEEQHLLDAVVGEIGLFVARREAEDARARLQKQLHHSDRLATIGTLAAGVAHEINEPLGAILGFAQLAQKTPDMPEAAQADLAKVVQSCLRAREIVRKLLIFARQQPPRDLNVDVNGVAEEALSFLRSRMASSGVELRTNLQRGRPLVAGDPIQLNQVVVNLVLNALQAMPSGGLLEVATALDGDHVLLRVMDTGSGMTDEVRERIFLPFFTTKEEGLGTGLGLSVVHGIVTAHGGSVRVASQLGLGTQFEVRLPAPAAPPAAEVQDA